MGGLPRQKEVLLGCMKLGVEETDMVPEKDSTGEATGPRGTDLILTWERSQNAGLFQKPVDVGLASLQAHVDAVGSLGLMSACCPPYAPFSEKCGLCQ